MATDAETQKANDAEEAGIYRELLLKVRRWKGTTKGKIPGPRPTAPEGPHPGLRTLWQRVQEGSHPFGEQARNA